MQASSKMLQRSHNRQVLDEIRDANQTKNLGKEPVREINLLAGSISEIARHRAWANPKKQRELIARVKRAHGIKH